MINEHSSVRSLRAYLCLSALLASLTSSSSTAQATRLSHRLPPDRFPPVIELQDLQPPLGTVLHGKDHYDQAGWVVEPAGDVNADGRGDLLIGAPGAAIECRTVDLNKRIRDAILEDFDGDLDLDLAFVETDTNTVVIHANDGQGSLIPYTAFPAMGVDTNALIATHLNADTVLDIVTANAATDSISIFHGDGDGTFTFVGTRTVGDLPTGLAAADFDDDGTMDIACSSVTSDNVFVFLNDGSGTLSDPGFVTATGNKPFSIAAANLDADEFADLVVANEDDDDVSIFTGLGTGLFGSRIDHPSGNAPADIALADFDGDTDLDMVVANRQDDPARFSYYRNDGAAGFASAVHHPSGGNRSIAAADFDHSGLPDVAVTATTLYPTVEIHNNLGGGAFTASTAHSLPAIPHDEFQPIPTGVVAGDISGDGYADLLAVDSNQSRYHYFENDGQGHFPALADSGEVYVVFGGPWLAGASSFDLANLDGTQGFVIRGLAARDELGYSVAGAGDFNGDDVDDFLLGAHLADQPGRTDAGACYVVFGAAGIGASGILDLAALDGTNGFVIHGINGDEETNDGDRLGTSVAGAGDFNGDGHADIAIGAPYSDSQINTGVPKAGSVYLLLGGTNVGSSGEFDLLSVNGVNGIRWYADENNLQVGSKITRARDVDGDSLPDLLIASGDPASQDRVYLVFGRGTPWLTPTADLDDLNGSDGFYMTLAWDASTGHDMDAAGDVNGDGANDFIIGSPKHFQPFMRSRATVVFGSAAIGSSGVLDLDALNGTDGFKLGSFMVGAFAGLGVAGGGDLNGDGWDDVVVGIPGADDVLSIFNTKKGKAAVVFGGPAVGAGGEINLMALDGTTGIEIRGASSGDITGRSATFCRDLDGDGVTDLVLGAPGNVLSPMLAGNVYIVFGRRTVAHQAPPFSSLGLPGK